MKTCKNCNLSFVDDKMFCKKCGKPLTSEYQIEPKEVAKKTVFEDRLKADPLNIELLHEYAQFLFNSLIFKETITVSLKILAISEKDGIANELLFKSYLKLNMLKEASEFGQQLLSEKPTDIFLLQELAEISGKLGNNYKETEYYTQMLSLQPANTRALLNKAHNFLEENQLEKALDIFSYLNREGQNDRITTIYAGINKALKADFKASIKLLSPILSEDEYSKQNDLNTNRGVLYLTYSLCQNSAGLPEIKNWATKINYDNLKQNHHPLDEQTAVLIAEFIINRSLNEIQFPSEAESQIKDLSNSYLPESSYSKNSNSKIAEIWYTIGLKQVEFKLLEDAVNSFQKASDLMPGEIKYKDKYAEYTNLFESNTRKKNRKTNFTMAASIIGLIIIVFSFFAYKSFVEKSAFELAQNLNTSSSYQTYLDKYPKGKYLFDALQLKEEASWNLAKTLNTAEGYNDFILNYANSKHYQEANSQKEDAVWKVSKSTKDYSNYIQQYPAGKYIKDIKYDMPDIERIKSDLIGQQIPGWRFAYLNEYESSEILNTAKGYERIEYLVKFKLKDQTSQKEYNCEIIAAYSLGQYGYYLNNVKMNYITFDYEIPVDNWVTITPLANCSWNAENSVKLFWKTYGWGNELKSGPDVPKLTLPSSDSYLLRSRENHSVTVRFTYKLNN